MTTTLTAPDPVRIRERVNAPAAHKVDRDLGIIYGVRILGAVSKNGYTYTPEAIRQSATQYEGKSVFIDHIDPEDIDRVRRMKDLFGNFRNVTYNDTEARGDLHYIKSHPMADQIAEAAEKFNSCFGISHDAYGHKEQIDGQTVVNSVPHVNSLDVVTTPATNEGLFESLERVSTTLNSEESGTIMATFNNPIIGLQEKLTRAAIILGQKDRNIQQLSSLTQESLLRLTPFVARLHAAMIRKKAESSGVLNEADSTMSGVTDPNAPSNRAGAMIAADDASSIGSTSGTDPDSIDDAEIDSDDLDAIGEIMADTTMTTTEKLDAIHSVLQNSTTYQASCGPMTQEACRRVGKLGLRLHEARKSSQPATESYEMIREAVMGRSGSPAYRQLADRFAEHLPSGNQSSTVAATVETDRRLESVLGRSGNGVASSEYQAVRDAFERRLPTVKR
ncbi:MAG: hypothetical protein JWM11_3023 [Planctomycetaceae bacterium]|nr:hypothetical protein [Planctomycetaceae bacterium]